MSKRCCSVDLGIRNKREKCASPENLQLSNLRENSDDISTGQAEIIISNVTFQTLPDVILEQIFQYVQARDLIKLCCLSKSLYWPAVSRLYNYLVLINNSETYMHGSDAQGDVDYKELWKVNYGTFLRNDNVKKLVRTLENNKELRPMVHGMTFYNTHLGMPYAQLLALTPNLKAHHVDCGFMGLLQNSMGSLEYVTVIPPNCPRLGPTLRGLRIIAFGVNNKKRYIEMAQNLLQSRAHENLKSLQFSSSEMLNSLVHWRSFLEVIGNRGVKLNLTSFGFYGSLNATETVNVLKKSIRLGNLRSLVLDVGDIADGPLTVLEAVTKHTPKLESLVINPSFKGFSPEVRGLCRVLEKNLASQLKELSISCEFVNPIDRERLQIAFLNSQKNLVKLKLKDLSSCFEDIETAVEMKVMAFHDWFAERQRQCFFPQILDGFHSRPFMQKRHETAIREKLKEIHDGLMHDVIYKNAPRDMPYLSQYFVKGVYIDMKQRGVFVNDETILFNVEDEFE